MSKAVHPLRKWRKSQPSPSNPDKTMSQEDLGNMVGVGSAQISLVESGVRGCSYGTAKKIIEITGGAVPLEALMREATV